MRKLVLITLAVGLLAAATFAAAEGLPSSKATFAYDELVALQSACSSPGCKADSDWQVILKQQIKMANQKDLFVDASLQCGIVTDTTVKSLNGSEDSAEARGTIRVRVRITAPDGSVSYAKPDSGVDATNTVVPDGIVFCDRIQTLRAKFSGLNCTADLTNGAVTCASPEELQLILKTLNANAFNFVAPNLVSGVHTIEVQARTSANVSTLGANGSLGNANAFIGAGSVAVETVRMIKGNVGNTLVEFE
jgi:hypothetical protein